MPSKMSRRSFFGRSIKVAVGAAATRLLGGGQQVIDWVAKYQQAILSDWQSPDQSSLRVINDFIATIQNAGFTLEQFARARGLTYLPLEFDMWWDDPWFFVNTYLPDVLKVFKNLGGM